jgi:hypothetical protein
LNFGDRVDVLPMLLSLAVLLLSVSFLLRATTDVLRDREAAVLVTRYIENVRVNAARASAKETEDGISQAQDPQDYGPYEADPWWEPYENIKKAADAAVLKAETRIGIRRFPRKLREARKILEIGVPLLFAAVALVLSQVSLSTFAAALFSALKP